MNWSPPHPLAFAPALAAVLCMAAVAHAAPVDPPAEASSVGLPAAASVSQLPTGLSGARFLIGDSGVDQAEQACLGAAVAQVVVDGCDNTPCAQPEVLAAVKSLTDLAPGRPIVAGQVGKAWERILRLGYFKTATVLCKVDGDGKAVVRWRVVGSQFVRGIDVSGNSSMFQDEVRAKLQIQPGDVLNIDTVDGRKTLAAQQDAIEALYRRNGFLDAKVQVSTRPVGPAQLRVVIVIDEGERKRITQTKIILQDPPRPTDVEERHGLICARIGERALRQAADTATMEVFSQREANRVRARVRTYLRRLGYGAPRVDVVHDPVEQAVRIEARPGKCALVRILIRDDTGGGVGGYVLSEDQALYDALPFGDSGQFDFEEAERGRQDLAGVLENRGYLFSDVRLDFRPVPGQMSQQVTSAVTYYVTTGYVSQVRGIFFHALDHPRDPAIGEDKLRTVINSKAYDFLDVGGYLQVDQLLADLDALRQHYLDAGHYQFHYAVVLPDGVTPTAINRRQRTERLHEVEFVYRYPTKGFRVRRPTGENFIYIDIDYYEGDRTRLRTLAIEGARQVTSDELRRLMPMHQGEVVSYQTLDDSLRVIEQRYRNNGFFRTTIKALCASSEPNRDEAPCTPAAMLARHVDMRLVIEEGERVDFGESFVAGNFITQTPVILRDMPQGGQPYSAAAMFETQRKLRNLGLFSQVSVATIGDEEKPPRDRLATVVNVVEGQNRYWEASAGFQTINTARSPYEQETVQSLKDFIDRSTTAADRFTTGFGIAQNLTLPNLLATSEAAYVNRNFLSTGKMLKLSAKIGVTVPPDYSGIIYERTAACTDAAAKAKACAPWYEPGVRMTPPWWSDTLRYAAILPTYQDSRLFGSEFGLRVVLPYLIHDYAIGPIDVDKAGGLLELTRRFGKLSASVAMDAGYIRTRAPEARGVDFTNLPEPQLSLIPSLSFDNTDSPLNPRRGFSVSLSLPYINASVKQNEVKTVYVPANFIKWDLTARSYLPLGDSMVLALLVHGGAGRSLGNDQTNLPQFARFRLGGGYSQSLLRGYSDFGVRQYDATGCTLKRDANDQPKRCNAELVATDKLVGDGDVLASGSAELRFPIAAAQGFWGATFWDFGGIADSWAELHPASIRQGLGVGLRWLLSGQIPARVDYAISLGAPRCRDISVDTAGTVSCTKDSFGEFSFGFLYAF